MPTPQVGEPLVAKSCVEAAELKPVDCRTAEASLGMWQIVPVMAFYLFSFHHPHFAAIKVSYLLLLFRLVVLYISV
jgi:hypothetical protein